MRNAVIQNIGLITMCTCWDRVGSSESYLKEKVPYVGSLKNLPEKPYENIGDSLLKG